MAKAKSQPPAAPRYAEPQIDLPDAPPQFAASSGLAEPDLAEIQEIARNASYLLLDERAGEIQLLSFGHLGGSVVRTFSSMDDGIGFVKATGITNCRCLQLPEGVVR